MIKAQYKPTLIITLLLTSVISLLFGIWLISIEQFPLGGFSLLAGLYLFLKYSSIKKENLKLHDTGFHYQGKLFDFTDIESIKALKQDDSMTPNLKHNPLRNGSIYHIQLKNESIQIVGKLYSNADNFMQTLSEKANIHIQPMKEE